MPPSGNMPHMLDDKQFRFSGHSSTAKNPKLQAKAERSRELAYKIEQFVYEKQKQFVADFHAGRHPNRSYSLDEIMQAVGATFMDRDEVQSILMRGRAESDGVTFSDPI